MNKEDYVNLIEINVPEETQIIKVVLPEGKEVFQTQERLDEVWIFLKEKNK